MLGDTTTAVQAVATSLDEALTALAPTVDLLGALDPDTLVAADGTIDVAALESAVEPLESARVGVAAAAQTLTTAPSRAAGDRVLGRVDEAGAELARQLGDLDGTLAGAIEAAQLVPPLLGADGPKRYFVAMLNPNEARGTGGLMGTYLIISADSGRITVEEVGSNGDLPNVPYTPPELGAQFIKRYEPGPRLVPNLNISPHHPAAGLLWQKSWEEKTGEVLDGAISADVVALGDLLTATGQQVTLPDGGSLTGAELTDFALTGIYEKFPLSSDVPARKAYQEAVTRDAFDLVTGSTEPRRPGRGARPGPHRAPHPDLVGRPGAAGAGARRGDRRHARGARRPPRGRHRDQRLRVQARRVPRAVADLRGGQVPDAAARTGRLRPDRRASPTRSPRAPASPTTWSAWPSADPTGRSTRPWRSSTCRWAPRCSRCRSTGSPRATRPSGSRTGSRWSSPWTCRRARSARSESSSASRRTTGRLGSRQPLVSEQETTIIDRTAREPSRRRGRRDGLDREAATRSGRRPRG